ncbi:hypothetical protein D3C79_576130 [compost metagenome]
MGLGQGDQFGIGQGRLICGALACAEVIDGELTRHGVGQQQPIVVGEGQPARGLGGSQIQLEAAIHIIGLQARRLEQRDPEPAPLGIEDDAVGPVTGGNDFLHIEIVIEQQQAIAAVIGHQQGAVIGTGELAQIAAEDSLLEPLAAAALE